MRDIFLLGAGFSRAVFNGMPLMKELSEGLRKTIPSHQQEAVAFGDDLEMWLTYLAQSHPWLTEAQNLRNRAQFLELTGEVGRIVGSAVHQAFQKGFPAWFKNLVCYWHESGSRSTVVTLNYDTLIEECLCEFPVREMPLISEIARQGNFRPRLRDVYPVPMKYFGADSSFRSDPALGYRPNDGPVGTFHLLKPHGSINWFYSGSAGFASETPHVSMKETGLRCSGSIRDLVPPAVPQETQDLEFLIAPPIANKIPYFENRTISGIWRKASEALIHSDRVFCLGYSLPETDLTFRFWLAAGLREQVIYIVNTDPKAADHYREYLPPSYRTNDSLIRAVDSMPRFVCSLIKADPDTLLSGEGGFADPQA